MDLLRIGPVALAERRLAWLDARQRLLAHNVANADTPGFRPMDAVPFAQLVSQRILSPAVAVTDARHIAPARPAGAMVARVGERVPNGNAVSLDEQAVRIAETDQAHALAMGLHRKYLGLFRTALGRN
ncbi:MAG: flagellar biosynthesis protein FlgB [Rubritepida sp.]|jgi:flagellar basal-body rod protein FlgB|nr:flagellar biosynthesis protein FlgB [Rubritepida sp.]